MKLKLADTASETQTIRTLTFVAADGAALPGYAAGAHVTFELGDLGTRSYSLVDWSGDAVHPDAYVFGIQQEVDGQGGSQAMHALLVGQEVKATLPKNDFPLRSDHPVVLIAGGIGITPMITMAAQLQRRSAAVRSQLEATTLASSQAWRPGACAARGTAHLRASASGSSC